MHLLLIGLTCRPFVSEKGAMSRCSECLPPHPNPTPVDYGRGGGSRAKMPHLWLCQQLPLGPPLQPVEKRSGSLLLQLRSSCSVSFCKVESMVRLDLSVLKKRPPCMCGWWMEPLEYLSHPTPPPPLYFYWLQSTLGQDGGD